MQSWSGWVAVVLAASYEPTGPVSHLNHLEPYLRTIFGFIGVSDVTFTYAGNDTFSGERLESSINEALADISKTIRKSDDHGI